MERKIFMMDQSGASQQVVTIPQGHNNLIVRLQGHTWAAILNGARLLVRTQSPNPATAFTLKPGTYTVRTDGKIENVMTDSFRQEPPLLEQVRQGTPAFLTLASDAPDRHVVDGIGEVVADGTSYCTITVQKMDMNGIAVNGSEHQDELFVRTTGGVVMDDKGGQRIRSLNLRSGRAAFRLVSETNPKVITVAVLSRNPLMANAEIQIEFV